ncbi:hypothetical protein Taro_039247 [Colocasia esculenta]|uniref:Protein kinase domain-containing protein n=1 Tax=Colocasia esculenta TaxID=4460 RepID=A0A843WR00_COLES|nr:hypothetical protein [Colocasia esculenta]
MADGTTRQQHVCLKVLSRVCPVFTSQNHQGTKQRSHDHQQLAELIEQAVQRERNLSAVYRARLERRKDYLRYCLDKANEHGFLEFFLGHQRTSPPVDVEPKARPWPRCMAVRITSLPAAVWHAKLNGWCIEPHEIELHEKIGQGTTADIYRGSWRGLDVAVKWIHSTYFCSNPCAKTWFVQELQTLSRQRHPFVLRLMGACLLPPERGIFTNRNPKSSTARDLKPSNIFLDDALHVRVADFGHSRFLLDGEQLSTHGGIGRSKVFFHLFLGTYVYMAPEVIRCEPYDEKCDVYSFGIILNELITGQHPYMIYRN